MRKLSKKKGIILAIVLAFTLVAFVGCGNGNDNTPTQGNNAQANNPVATTPPANNQQENNPTTTPLPTNNIPTETPAPTTEPEETQPPVERRELNRSEESMLANMLSSIRLLCREAGCSDEDTEKHIEMAQEMWLNSRLDRGIRNSETNHEEAHAVVIAIHGE